MEFSAKENQPNQKVSYKNAGVDIDEANQFVSDIKPAIQKTLRPEVKKSQSGYAGLFQLDLQKYPDPILCATTDGVGTKLKLAIDHNQLEAIGIDCVAMCANDLICMGAEPLFFLDYFACGKLVKEQANRVIQGITDALYQVGASLLGGETAEMPGFYQPPKFDVAGFMVGVVGRDQVITGQSIADQDLVVGFASSGLHSNGFSLIHKLIELKQIDLNDPLVDGILLKDALLQPTILYVRLVLELIKNTTIKGLAHITGGGLIENVARILPTGLVARINADKIPVLPVYQYLRAKKVVESKEMWRVFNQGIGLVLVLDPKNLDLLNQTAQKMGIAPVVLGQIEKQKPDATNQVLIQE